MVVLAWMASGCSKEDQPVISFEELSSGTQSRIQSVKKLSAGTWIACGGKDNSGIVLLSENDGTTWKTLCNTFDQVLYDIYFTDSLTGYAGGGNAEIFKTEDGGQHWAKLWINVPAFPLAYRQPVRKIFAVSDSVIFFCGGGEFQAGMIIQTTDAGSHWNVQTFEHELRSIFFYDAWHGIACGYGIILKTENRGITWSAISSPDEFFTSVTSDNQSNLWISGYNGSILLVPDFASPVQISDASSKLFGSRYHFNCISSSAMLVAAMGTDGSIAVRKINQPDFRQYKSFNGTSIKCFEFANDDGGIAAGDNGKIFRFTFKI